MEVRHINRSSSATRQPKVDTGAKIRIRNSAAEGLGGMDGRPLTAIVRRLIAVTPSELTRHRDKLDATKG